MPELIELINIAESNKPKMGEDCNHCGWCCMTEVCSMGQNITGDSKYAIPCKLLVERDGKYYCSVADQVEDKQSLGFDTGCCAQTQTERLNELMS